MTSKHMRPMAERRQLWRERTAFDGYDWLRTELRDLDRRRAGSLTLRARTYLPKKRVMRDAIAYLTRQRVMVEADLPAARTGLDGPRGVRTMHNAARTDYDRFWTAHVWLMLSVAYIEGDRPAVAAGLRAASSSHLAGLAERVAGFPGGGG